MIFIRSGRGGLVPVLGIAGMVVGYGLVSVTGLEFLMPIGPIAASLALWYLGVYFKNKPGKKMIDPETNEMMEFRKTHTFFWISLRRWGIISGILIALPMLISAIMLAFK